MDPSLNLNNTASTLVDSICLEDEGVDSRFGAQQALESVSLAAEPEVTLLTSKEILDSDLQHLASSSANLEPKSSDAPSLSQYFQTQGSEATITFPNLKSSPFDELLPASELPSTAETSLRLDDIHPVITPVKNPSPPLPTDDVDGGSTTAEQTPALFKFFSEVKSGDDQEGKAFFDLLAAQGGGPLSDPGSKVSSTTDVRPSESNKTPPVAKVLRTPSIDDPFSASIQASESDRRHDAWIPSQRTLHALRTMATSPTGTYFPERDQLTMPGIILEEDLVDPVTDLLKYHIGEEAANNRTTLNANSVPQDEAGLRQLIEANCHRAAVNLSGRLLALLGQGVGKSGHLTKVTPQILQIWFVRLSLLIKLREFDIAQVEAQPFNDFDKPDLFYEFYPELYGARKGSMVPFSFRIILAELPLHLGQHQDSLDKLYAILATIQQILKNLANGLAEDGSMIELSKPNRTASHTLWEKREMKVFFSIINCLIAQKDYPSTINMIQTIANKDSAHKVALWSLMGRVYLQLGDVAAAHDSFRRARECSTQTTESKVGELINSGLLDIAHNKYDAAYYHFKEANDLHPNNPVIVNNMAVCLLYMRRLRDALQLVEGTVHQDLTNFLHEGVLCNVCTLYELESSRSSERKQDLLKAVSGHVGDGFNVSCLKLPALH